MYLTFRDRTGRFSKYSRKKKLKIEVRTSKEKIVFSSKLKKYLKTDLEKLLKKVKKSREKKAVKQLKKEKPVERLKEMIETMEPLKAVKTNVISETMFDEVFDQIDAKFEHSLDTYNYLDKLRNFIHKYGRKKVTLDISVFSGASNRLIDRALNLSVNYKSSELTKRYYKRTEADDGKTYPAMDSTPDSMYIASIVRYLCRDKGFIITRLLTLARNGIKPETKIRRGKAGSKFKTFGNLTYLEEFRVLVIANYYPSFKGTEKPEIYKFRKGAVATIKLKKGFKRVT